MGHRLLVLAAIVLGGCVSPSIPPQAASCPAAATTGPDAEAIRRQEAIGAATNVSGWSIEEARAFFDPNWISVQPDGSRTDLSAVLAQFHDGRSRPWAERFDIVALDVWVYCDMAIAVGTAEARPRGLPAAAPALRMIYTNIWRRDGGRWLYLANQFVKG